MAKDRSMFKMTPEQLTSWMNAKRRTNIISNKRGKGSYDRRKFKRCEDM